MYNKCESCKKDIADATDCRLYTNDNVSVHTLCRRCYEHRMELKKKN